MRGVYHHGTLHTVDGLYASSPPSLTHACANPSPPDDIQGQERRNSTERRRSSAAFVGADGGEGNPLTGPITRDEVFNLLEEKADRKDLEKRMAAIVTRYCGSSSCTFAECSSRALSRTAGFARSFPLTLYASSA